MQSQEKINLSDITDESMLSKNEFKDKQSFSKYIEQKAYENDIGILEALLNYADENDIEAETMAKLISHTLKEKLQFEAEENSLLRNDSNRLDF